VIEHGAARNRCASYEIVIVPFMFEWTVQVNG
jgi:hypothetical protein